MIDVNYEKRLAKRYASEKRFRFYGAFALAITLAFLVYLLTDIVRKGWPAFFEHHATLSVNLDPAKLDKENLGSADFSGLVKDSWMATFPEITARADKKKLTSLLSQDASDALREAVIANPSLIGTTVQTEVLLSDNADMALKGIGADAGGALISQVAKAVPITQNFAWRFFTNSDSREPELAGLRGAIVGSLFTVAIALLIGLPLGVAAALYLEQFARKNRWTNLIEVNINNLAAVPSIIFGLLGLAMFLNFMGLPRSSPLVGGLVLALLVLPTIIIASRAALRAVPP
jgi:phosphate transport system permease protein